MVIPSLPTLLASSSPEHGTSKPRPLLCPMLFYPIDHHAVLPVAPFGSIPCFLPQPPSAHSGSAQTLTAMVAGLFVGESGWLSAGS